MKLIIADTIFDEFPELFLGIVILHDIDDAQDQPEITALLRQAEAAQKQGALGGAPWSARWMLWAAAAASTVDC